MKWTVTIDNLVVSENLRNLYKYIRENGLKNRGLRSGKHETFLTDIFQKSVSRAGGKILPQPVAKMIEAKVCGNTENKLFKNRTQSRIDRGDLTLETTHGIVYSGRTLNISFEHSRAGEDIIQAGITVLFLAQ